MIKFISNFLFKGDNRSLLVKKNIILSFLFRIISIVVSLLLVPISISYLSPEKYGIWITISSIISWMTFFDFGLAHGFRNRFAESIANGDFDLARKYVSTTYIVMAIVFFILMLLTSMINFVIDWCTVLNISQDLGTELNKVFQILIIFFCLKMILDIFLTMMTAYQRPAVSMGIISIGDIISLVLVYILTLFSYQNLSLLALVITATPCIVTFSISVLAFKRNDFKKISPSLKFVDFSLVKKIFGIGSQFFVIMISMLFIFQFTNIIITRELGASSVTLYNVTYKIFNVVIVVMTILMTPLWSAFTDAYTKNDYIWMKKCLKRVEKLGLFLVPIIIILLLSSEFIFDIWLGGKVQTSFYFTIMMALFAIFRVLGQIYMYPLNGIGKIRLQLISYLIIAFIAIPSIIYFTRIWGLIGTMIIPTITFLIQMIVNRIQLIKIINKSATGIWNK